MFSDTQASLYDGMLNENVGSKDKTTRYKVILKGIGGRRETKDTFAIKLSLMAKVPVTRTRFLIQNTPSICMERIWQKEGSKVSFNYRGIRWERDDNRRGYGIRKVYRGFW